MATPSVIAAVISCVFDGDDKDDLDTVSVMTAMHNIEHPPVQGADTDAEILSNLRASGGHFLVFSQGVEPAKMKTILSEIEATLRAWAHAATRASSYRQMIDCPPAAADCPVARDIATATPSWERYRAAMSLIPALSIKLVRTTYDHTVVRIETAWSQDIVNRLHAHLLAVHNRVVLNHRYRDVSYVTMVSTPLYHPTGQFPPDSKGCSVTCPRWGEVLVHPGIAARIFGHRGASIKHKMTQIRQRLGGRNGRWCHQPMIVPVRNTLTGAMMITLVHDSIRHMSSEGTKQYIGELYRYVMGFVRRVVREGK